MAHRTGALVFARQCLFDYRSFSKCSTRFSSSSVSSSKSEEPEFALEEYEDVNEEIEAEIEAKRNKSRLSEKHYNIFHGIPPAPDSYEFHKSIKYKRKIYGLYGSASGIDPSTLWPNKSDLDDIMEYESVAYPNTFHQMVSKVRQIKLEEQKIIDNRQKKIAENLKKVNQWMKEVEGKKEKKLKELAASKEKRDKMLEEVRRQLGYNVDMKDEKFKLAMMQKEKDMKKKVKEEKAKAKQERLLRALDQESKS